MAVPEGKFKWLKVSFGEELFGLDREGYGEISRDVDCIIHNAWKVRFFLFSFLILIITSMLNKVM